LPDTAEGEAGALPPACELTIVNRRGLHARASAKFVRLVEAFDAVVHVQKDGQSVEGTSIMGLLMLAAGPGSTISVSAEGPEAAAAVAAVTRLVEEGFGEDRGED
jgi:phosphocarrier protein HPr